jgi:hypothetical protein
MKELRALVLMQLKDKLKLNYKSGIRNHLLKLLFEFLKFAVVGAASYLFFFISSMLSIFSMYRVVPSTVLIPILMIILFLSIMSCMVGLTDSLYYSDDNKVLITYPVSGGKIFISKLIVFYISELKRSFSLSVPIFIGYAILINLNWFFYIWVFICFAFISMLPVVIGAILSVPWLYVKKFLNNYPLVKFILGMLVVACLIVVIVWFIGLIPQNVNLVNDWYKISAPIQKSLLWFREIFFPVYLLIVMVVGRSVSMTYTYVNFEGWLTFVGVIALIILLGSAIIFGVQKMYISMASKTFEYRRSNNAKTKKNKTHSIYVSSFLQEGNMLKRNSDYIVGTVATYIMAPIMVLLLNQIFGALSIREMGRYMTYGFSLLMITLPIFASNSIIATIFSREGRAGYMRKTLPTDVFIPLLIKLIPFAIFSTASLIVSLFVFNLFARFDILIIVIIGLAIVLLQIGMILWSALADVKKPQNEMYATISGDINNPNENFIVVIGFLVSMIFSAFSYVLLMENASQPIWGALKMLLIGMVFCTVCFILFKEHVKAFYYDVEGGT